MGQGRRSRLFGAHGGQVAQVHGQGFMAQGKRVDVGKEMAPLHQHVGGHGPLHSGGRAEQGTVVANAQVGTAGGAQVRIRSNSFKGVPATRALSMQISGSLGLGLQHKHGNGHVKALAIFGTQK